MEEYYLNKPKTVKKSKIKQFDDDKDLMDFVIRECGGMKYEYSVSTFLNHKHAKLTIKSKPNFDFIMYASDLIEDQFNTTLVTLEMRDLKIKKIPDDFLMSLENLYSLNVSYNLLLELPEVPDSLGVLICNNNFLTKLPLELPDRMTSLICFNNQITNIFELPLYLVNFQCGNNLLMRLPQLPRNLITFHCFNNPGYRIWRRSEKYNKFGI